MTNLYTIAGQTINLDELVYVGRLIPERLGLYLVPLIFNFNSNVDVPIYSGQDGAPPTSSEGSFVKYCEAEREKLIEAWKNKV